MCNVYNTVGCLTAIKKELADNRINNFSSIKELLHFLDNDTLIRTEIIEKSHRTVREEKKVLSIQINTLEKLIDETRIETRETLQQEIEKIKQQLPPTSSTEELWPLKSYKFLKRSYLKLKIRIKEHLVDNKINLAIDAYLKDVAPKKERLLFIETMFDMAVKEACASEIYEHERRKTIIEHLKPNIFGAIGEHKVVNELKNLSDDYFLINDFCFHFEKALYDYKKNSYIKSIQIDHILVSSAGIFLIETKNWSRASLMNYHLRSPIEQIQRTNYALGRILQNSIKLESHHWGEKRIPIKNTIVLINEKPQGEFRGAYVLRLNELLRFVERCEPCLSQSEVRNIATYLRNTCMQEAR